MADIFMTAYLLTTFLVFCIAAATSKKPYGRGTTGEADFEAATFAAIMWPLLAIILAAAFCYSKLREASDE